MPRNLQETLINNVKRVIVQQYDIFIWSQNDFNLNVTVTESRS